MAENSVYELLLKIKAEKGDVAGLVSALRDVVSAEEATKKAAADMAVKMEEAARATQRLENIAASGKAMEKLALDYRRTTQEIRQLAQTQGNAALAAQAQANVNAQFAARVAEMNTAVVAVKTPIADMSKAVETAGTVATKSSGSYVNLIRQLNDVGVMAAMGASPLQILATQGEQVAFSLKEAGLTGAKFASALPMLASAASVVAVAAAAAATAWAVYGNWAADGTMATERARDAMIAAGVEAAALGTALSSAASDGWAKFQTAASDTESKIAELTGTLGKGAAAANKDVQKLRDEAGPALLELGRRQVETTRALNAAVAEANRGGSGAAEAAALAADLRPKLAAITAELTKRKAALADATENALLLGSATDANTAADERARLAAQALAEAKRRQAEAERAAREEAARAREEARKHLEAILAEVAAIGAYYDVVDKSASVRADLASEIDAITEARKAQIDVTNRAAIAEADLALALSQGAISLDEYNQRKAQLNSGTTGGSVPNISAGTSPQGAIGALGNAGPWGALIAGIIQAISNGLDNLGDLFHDFTLNLNEAIGNIGNDLGENLGRWIEEGTKSVGKMIGNLIGGLIGNLPEIITQLTVGLIKAVFSADFWTNMWDGLWKGLKKLWDSTFSVDSQGKGVAAKQNEVAWWNDLYTGQMTADEFWSGESPNAKKMKAKSGSYASGTEYIARDGMYQLHKGERVQNRSQVTSDAANMGGRARMRSNAGRLTLEIESDSFAEYFADMQRRGFVTLGGA